MVETFSKIAKYKTSVPLHTFYKYSVVRGPPIPGAGITVSKIVNRTERHPGSGENVGKFLRKSQR